MGYPVLSQAGIDHFCGNEIDIIANPKEVYHSSGSGRRVFFCQGPSRSSSAAGAHSATSPPAPAGSAPSNSKRPATVTAGYNVETGQYAAGGSLRGACAEMCVVAQLGGDASRIRPTSAVRPRTGDSVDICMVCEARYGRSAFVPQGTKFLSDFLLVSTRKSSWPRVLGWSSK